MNYELFEKAALQVVRLSSSLAKKRNDKSRK